MIVAAVRLICVDKCTDRPERHGVVLCDVHTTLSICLYTHNSLCSTHVNTLVGKPRCLFPALNLPGLFLLSVYRSLLKETAVVGCNGNLRTTSVILAIESFVNVLCAGLFIVRCILLSGAKWQPLTTPVLVFINMSFLVKLYVNHIALLL